MKRVQVNKEDTSNSQTNLSMNPANGISNSNLAASNTDLTSLKSMTSSYTASSRESDAASLNAASMTASMISPSESDQPRFKTPLLQTILSKARINNIYHKYASDANSQTNEPSNKSDEARASEEKVESRDG